MVSDFRYKRETDWCQYQLNRKKHGIHNMYLLICSTVHCTQFGCVASKKTQKPNIIVFTCYDFLFCFCSVASTK